MQTVFFLVFDKTDDAFLLTPGFPVILTDGKKSIGDGFVMVCERSVYIQAFAQVYLVECLVLETNSEVVVSRIKTDNFCIDFFAVISRRLKVS